jgi:hypothetical protein
VCCGIVHFAYRRGSAAHLPPCGCLFVVRHCDSSGSARPDAATRGIVRNGMMFAKSVRVRSLTIQGVPSRKGSGEPCFTRVMLC